MESIVAFIKAALPWVLMGIAVLIWVVNAGRKKKSSEMDEQKEMAEKERKMPNYETAGMCIGMCAGMIIGRFLYDNMTIGMCVGMCLGLVVGSSIDRKKRG